MQTAVAGATAGDDINVIGNQGDYALGSGITTDPGTPIHFKGVSGRPRLIFGTGGLRLQAGTAENLYIEADSSSTALGLDSSAASADRVIVKAGGLGHGCYLNDATITNSLCWAGASGDLAVETDGSATLRNVTAVGGTRAAVLIFGRSDCSCVTATATLVNVIARSAAGGVDLEGNSDGTANAAVDLSHSNYTTTASTGLSPDVSFIVGAGNQSTAPRFVDAAAGNFHEAAGSVTIDAGANDGANGTKDLDGNPRITPTATDIGAYEFTNDTTPPDTTITKKPKSKIKTRRKAAKVKVSFSSEADATFECRLDKADFKPCSSPFTTKAKSKGGKGKKHTISIQATDGAGNTGDPAIVKFKVIKKD